MIPLVAAFVGWFTNYLAVQMIFYPIRWRGLPIYKIENQPLGFIGWQGIVPAKTEKMSISMVNATLTQLLSIEEVVQRLDPAEVASRLLPQAPAIFQPILDEVTAVMSVPLQFVVTKWMDYNKNYWQQDLARRFLKDLTVQFQKRVNELLNLRSCVVEQMMADRSLLGKLFQIAGRKELTFLTESGLWFGFLLGLIQLLVAIYWDNPWSLSIGGLVVGLATNWLALKWIFEPVNPKKVGPFVLQGLFLRRQKEVSVDFSKFFATRVLRSEKLWKSILTDPSTAPIFASLFAEQLSNLVSQETGGLVNLQSEQQQTSQNQLSEHDNKISMALHSASTKATARLYDYLDNAHDYVDTALDIEETLRTRMMAMTPAQFERVLHPIFEEDELTLILAGGGLGFLAGLLQQGLSTGALLRVLPRRPVLGIVSIASLVSCTSVLAVVSTLYYVLFFAKNITFPRRLLKRIRDPKLAFAVMDKDRSGYLDFNELGQISRDLGFNISKEELESAFLELDKNRNGRVSFEAFEDWWNRDEGNKFHKKLAKELGLEA